MPAGMTTGTSLFCRGISSALLLSEAAQRHPQLPKLSLSTNSPFSPNSLLLEGSLLGHGRGFCCVQKASGAC